MSTIQVQKHKTTSLQIPLDISDKIQAEEITQKILGLSLSSTVKLLVKIISQTKQIPLEINLSKYQDETSWLINNPGYGEGLLETVKKINDKTANLVKFENFESIEQKF